MSAKKLIDNCSSIIGNRKKCLQLSVINYQLSIKSSGFTLIELMIVIAIIAVMATVGLASYSNAQTIARDGKRKQDLRQIQTALEVYYQRNSHYPTSSGAGYPGSPSGDQWINGLDSSYINILPSGTDNSHGYSYLACGSGDGWALYVLLENPNDPDNYGNKPQNLPACLVGAFNPGALPQDFFVFSQ